MFNKPHNDCLVQVVLSSNLRSRFRKSGFRDRGCRHWGCSLNPDHAVLCQICTAFEQERTEIRRQKNAQFSNFDFLSDSSKYIKASGTDLMQYLQKNPMCRVVPKYKKTEMLVKRHGASAMLDTMASICDPYLYGAKRHQKSGLYAWVVLIIAVFYLLPASQLMYKVSTSVLVSTIEKAPESCRLLSLIKVNRSKLLNKIKDTIKIKNG